MARRTWRQALNHALARTTGYRIVRSSSVAPRAPRAAARRAPDPAKGDDEAQRIIGAVKPRTMTSAPKLHALIVSTRYIEDRRIPGAIVECGVWRGGSMQAVAMTLLGRGASERDLHLFDTFEGMPPPTERDQRHDGKQAAQMLSRQARSAKVWAVADLDDVRAGMAETGYPSSRLHFHRGRVEETIPAAAPDTIALLRLDTDWYESTRHELEHLYDRVPSGGVIILDDYAYWQGARAAVDEFLAAREERLLLVPLASGRIAVKP